MHHWKSGAAVAAMLLTAMPASADWPPVKWGMTQEQVLAAMPGAVARAWKGEDNDVWGRRMLADAPNADGDIALTAEFYFDAKHKKLVFVRQVAKDPKSCADWRKILVARYGPGTPGKKDGLGIMDSIRWTDSDGDTLLFLSITMPESGPYYCHLIDGVPADQKG